MTALGEPCPVPVADLLRDKRFQIRAKLDRGMVNRYANVLAAGNEMPPVRVAIVAGVPCLVDGWHRVAAHEAAGRGTVVAVLVAASEDEARWWAAKANLTHGLPLKSNERRAVFRAYVGAKRHLKPKPRREGPHPLKSYREIAADLGGIVRHTTVRFWMREDFRDLFLRMGGGEGSRENEKPGHAITPETVNRNTAQGHLEQALAASRGMHDPDLRGSLVELAERIAKAIRDGGEWHRPDANPDF